MSYVTLIIKVRFLWDTVYTRVFVQTKVQLTTQIISNQRVNKH